MPWREATLHGKKVFARAREDGTLWETEGRVDVRYRQSDPKVYRAMPRNLHFVAGSQVLPDDACVPAAAPNDASSTSGSGAKTAPKGTGTKKTSAPLGAPSAETWIVYTDGACSGNPGPAGLGVVVRPPEGDEIEISEYLGEATNNIAELTAILRAVEHVPKDVPSRIHTDSRYAIGVLSQGWKAKANQDLIRTTKERLADRRIEFVYVPGHAGVELNERADVLARDAITRRR